MSNNGKSGHHQHQHYCKTPTTMVELRASGVTCALDRPTTKAYHYTILTVLDIVFSSVVAAPAVVGYWRGTWGLSDYYMFPSDPAFGNVVSIAIGLSGLFTFSVVQELLDEVLHPDKHRLSYYVFSRLYTLVFGFCCVNAWRGTWKALDLYTESTPSSTVITTAVSAVILALFRVVRNISAPPFSLSLDTCNGYFQVPTMFRTNIAKHWSLYVLDCAFSVCIVGTLVVFVWRGVWVMFDIYLYPGAENKLYSAFGSLIIGYAVVSVTFSVQPLMRYVCSNLTGLKRILVADLFVLLSFFGTVNVWRGIWMILDLWLFPDDLQLSCLITLVGCFLFLMLLNCSNSILVRGICIDAEEEDGKCVAFPCHYLRIFFKVEREKKKERQQNLIDVSKEFAINSEANEKDTENGSLLTSSPNKLTNNPDSFV